MILRVPGDALLLRTARGRGTISARDALQVLSRSQMILIATFSLSRWRSLSKKAQFKLGSIYRLLQCRSARFSASTRTVVKCVTWLESTGVHSIGSRCRARAGAVASLCRRPHDRQIAPTCRISVSFDISFSRTASEPAMTGLAQPSQG